MERFYVVKDPDSTLDYAVDWTTALSSGETITNHVWTVPTGITNAGVANTTTRSVIRLGGGTASTNYIVNVRITTSLNNILDRDIILIVEPAIRSGMVYLILLLRSLTDAQIGETTVNNLAYWTDHQLQQILDLYRTRHVQIPLTPIPQTVGGQTVYYLYEFPHYVDNPEYATDSPFFSVTNKNGDVLTDYTYEVGTNYITFDGDQEQGERYLTVSCYNLRLAAARVWSEKGAQRAALVDWKAGGQTLNEDQEYQHCMSMVNYFLGTTSKSALYGNFRTGGLVTLRKAGYGQTDQHPDYYSEGTSEGYFGPVA